MQTEILTTLLVFLSSANREIIKSTLGYIKLAIHTLPVDLLRPHLKELVPALLAWSHDHKNHFKLKVRHIFERMIRRLGWNDVYQAAGEDQAAKVLVNIKKRKDRAKRKKAREEDDESEEEEEVDFLRHVPYTFAHERHRRQNRKLPQAIPLRTFCTAARVSWMTATKISSPLDLWRDQNARGLRWAYVCGWMMTNRWISCRVLRCD